MPDSIGRDFLVKITSKVVVNYVSNNSVPAAELPALLCSVHDVFRQLANPQLSSPSEAAPAVPIRKSVTDEHLVCLEDGQAFKTLKRHLAMVHGMTPDQYRKRWRLGADYPMVAPAYAKTRSDLARSMGLGQIPPKPAPKPRGVTPVAETTAAPSARAKRGRRAGRIAAE